MGSVLLTGANGSLALPAVDYLLSQYPSYTLVLTVRDDSVQDVNTAKLRDILAKHPKHACQMYKLDLSSLPAVAEFTKRLHNEISSGKLNPLAAIICNAMTWSLQSGMKFTTNGYEQCMVVNHLAQFSMTLRLLADMDPQNGRIVFLSSDSHWAGKAGFEVYPPKIPENLELIVKPEEDPVGQEVGRGFQRYGLSKLAVVMVMYELGRRIKTNENLKGISVLAVDPGGLLDSRAMAGSHVPSSWTRLVSVLNWVQPGLKFLKPTLRRSADSAKDVVDLAVKEEFKGIDGHFEMRKKAASSPDSLDEEMQRRLWEKSVEWCGLKKEDTVLSF